MAEHLSYYGSRLGAVVGDSERYCSLADHGGGSSSTVRGGQRGCSDELEQRRGQWEVWEQQEITMSLDEVTVELEAA